MTYITNAELAELVSNERLDGMSEPTVQIFLDSASEVINSYCKKTFAALPPVPVPATVKIVAADLVNIMLNDVTKQSENKGDYSYTANDKAFAIALGKLDSLFEQQSGKSKVNAYVI